MKAHVELTTWIDTTEPVLKGDVDRLTQTYKVYLDACGGLPEMDYTIHGETVCIAGSAIAGKSLITKAPYIKKMILEALSEAGMEVTE